MRTEQRDAPILTHLIGPRALLAGLTRLASIYAGMRALNRLGGQMEIELRINNSIDPLSRYVSWSPSPSSIRLTNATGVLTPVTVQLRNKAGGGGQVVFRKTVNGTASSTLSVSLPLDGSSVKLFTSGRFGSASVADRDATIQVLRGTTLIAEIPMMVRIRKDANTLTLPERDRFIAAFAKLNNQGAGRFVDFRNMHTNAGSP